MSYKEGAGYVQYGHPAVLKKASSANDHGSFQKRTRIFVGGLGPKQARKKSSPRTLGSPPPFAAIPGDAAGDDAGDDAVGDDNVENSGSESDSSDSDGSDSDDSVEGSVTSDQSAEGLPAGPSTVGDWAGRGTRFGHRRTTTLAQQHQRRMPFVASMMARRRPAMRRRKSSKNAVGPSKLRSEVRFDSEDVSEDSKQDQPGPQLDCQAQTAELEGKTVEQSKPVEEEEEAKAGAPDPEKKETGLSDAEKLQGISLYYLLSHNYPNLIPETKATEAITNLKHILTESALRSRAQQGQGFNCVSTRLHPQGARNMPIKLVDDHFRLRFARELQREETMLREIDSLPEEERKEVQAQSISALTGLLPPKKPQFTWVIVSDEEAEREAEEAVLNASSDIASSSSSSDAKWPVTATSPSPSLSPSFTSDHCSSSPTSGTWSDDYALDQAVSPSMQVEAVSRMEGLSYMSSVRAASRLRAPGQLSVLLRAQQYGHFNAGDLYP